MFFEKVYRRCSERNNQLEYKMINENVDMNEELIESLLRSGMAIIKRTDTGQELYYNI